MHLKELLGCLRSNGSYYNLLLSLTARHKCCIIYSFIRIDQLKDLMLERQVLRLLAIIDKDISSELILEKDIHNRITNVQVIDVWTTYRDIIVLQMFVEYQTRRNTTNLIKFC